MALRVTQEQVSVPDFDKTAAVDLFVKQNSLINGLWGIYIVATFTAAAFSFTKDQLSPFALLAVTAGFWAFALGHLVLLRQALSINIKLKQSLRDTINSNDSPYSGVVSHLANTANPPWVSMVIHLFIDACVTSLIWRCQLFLNVACP